MVKKNLIFYLRFFIFVLLPALLIIHTYPKVQQEKNLRLNNRSSQKEVNFLNPQGPKEAIPKENLNPLNSKVTTANTNRIKVPVLLYHYIGGNPNPEDKKRYELSQDPFQFDNQMAYLMKEGFETIDPFDLYDNLTSGKPLPQRPVILTFDDAYIDFYYNAYPILKKYNLKATVFVPTGLVGQKAYLPWGMIEELAKDSNISFQSHGVSHQSFTNLSSDQIFTELIKSKEELFRHTQKPVKFLAYPYGNFNNEVIQKTKEAGYLMAFSTILGSDHFLDNLFTLNRVKVPGQSLVSTLALKLNNYN